jgi:hypothetical protein
MDTPDFEQEKIERLRRAMYSRELADKLKARPRRSLDEERPLVGEEWHDDGGTVPGSVVAPRVIGYTRKVLWWFLGLSIVFFLGALGFFGYYFALGEGASAAAPQNIQIDISGPPQVAGGEPTKLQVSITNRNKVALELADLVVTYPPGTRSPSDFESDFPSQRISLGRIDPGGRQQGVVTAVFSGESGKSAPVLVELEYRVAGSNAIFVAKNTYDVILDSSPVVVSVEGNTQTTSGQPVQFTVTVASNSAAPLSDVLAQVSFPFGFKLTSSSPAASSPGLWSIGNLLPGERKTILVSGTLSGESGDKRVFRVQAGTRPTADVPAISTVLAENSHTVEISQAFLGIAVSTNKQSGASAVAAPGEAVIVSVAYQNNLPTIITDAVVVARLSGISIDGTTVHSSDGFFRSTDATVLWDKTTTNGVLASLPPGAKGTLGFSFQMPTSTALASIVNPKLVISVNAAGKRISENSVPQSLQATARHEIRVASNLQLNAQALYYANPFGSNGPLPPKAGAETTYALVLTVTNTTSRLSDAKVTGTLPSYVRWIGGYAPAYEKFTFNQSDGTFVWDLGEVTENVGVGGGKPRQIAISIGLTPSTSQIGQQVELARGIVFSAMDQATGQKITRKTTPEVSTNLLQVGKSSSESVVGTDPGFSPTSAIVVK